MSLTGRKRIRLLTRTACPILAVGAAVMSPTLIVAALVLISAAVLMFVGELTT